MPNLKMSSFRRSGSANATHRKKPRRNAPASSVSFNPNQDGSPKAQGSTNPSKTVEIGVNPITKGNTKWATKKLTSSQRLAQAAERTIKAAEEAAGKPLPSLREKKFPVRLRRKMPKRKRAGANNNTKPGVFSTFTLNKDPDCSEYMPYDDVSYPRLRMKQASGQAFSELESMWMVGFIHHNKKTKDVETAKQLEPFLRLPGSTVLPGTVEKDLRALTEKNLTEMKSELSPRFKDPNEIHDPSARDSRTKMSGEERYRLNELGDELVKKVRIGQTGRRAGGQAGRRTDGLHNSARGLRS